METKETISSSKYTIKFLRNIFVLVFIISTSIGLGYYLGLRNFYVKINGYPSVNIERDIPKDKKDLEFQLFWTVWDRLTDKYYDKDKLIPAKMVYGAIRGMVSSLGDPYTVFLPPTENKIVQQDLKGSFDGVGIQIGYRKEWLTVIAPVTGSPADKKGVKAGDIIYSIRDERKNIKVENTQGLSVEEAVSLIRGEKGSSVFLTLVREGVQKPFEVELVRDILDIPSVSVSYVGDAKDIAMITISKFSAETKAEWDEAVLEVLTKDFKGIILDLRNNPGGYMKSAIDIGTDFMDQGSLVVIEQSANQKQEYRVEDMGRLKNRKLIILINKGSASASEILSGALRDNKKILLVGETSFGKGTIQEPEELDNGVGLHVTIAKWLTPNGYWVNEKGLKPDHEITDDPDTSEDEQVLKAVKLLEEMK